MTAKRTILCRPKGTDGIPVPLSIRRDGLERVTSFTTVDANTHRNLRVHCGPKACLPVRDADFVGQRLIADHADKPGDFAPCFIGALEADLFSA